MPCRYNTFDGRLLWFDGVEGKRGLTLTLFFWGGGGMGWECVCVCVCVCVRACVRAWLCMSVWVYLLELAAREACTLGRLGI